MRRYLLPVFCLTFCACGLSANEEIIPSEPKAEEAPREEKPSYPSVSFKPFTGEVKGTKVRVRLHPDLEGYVVQELTKNDLVVVVGEEGDFWEVEPPTPIKAYVFRSFVLDNTIEGNRVNVRLEPTLESPIISHLNTGDHIEGVPSQENNKWLEIDAPQSTHFFVAKDFVEQKGPRDLKVKLDRRRQTVEKLYDSTVLMTKNELRKPFEEIDIKRLAQNYKAVIRDFKDFPNYVEQATEALATLQEIYLQKKIAYLESKTASLDEKQEQPTTSEATVEKSSAIFDDENIETAAPDSFAAQFVDKITDKMNMWKTVEDSIYLSWASLHPNSDASCYREDQNLSSIVLTGIVESYSSAVKNRPGDYILRDKNNVPIAYIYSTEVNLENQLGEKVNLRGVSRSNNNFAFPAYFILSQED